MVAGRFKPGEYLEGMFKRMLFLNIRKYYSLKIIQDLGLTGPSIY